MDVNRSLSKGVLSCVFVGFVLWRSVCCISVAAPAEVSVVRGGTVSLTCSFTSSSRITSLMSIDWTFRPHSGGPAKTFFHFSSQAYLPEEDYFKGRVKWVGSPSRGEASIQLLNASLTDNGTYTCAVRNPPDVHGHPAQTVLTVTPQRLSVMFTDVGVLLVFVLVPSGIITLVLLGRILCPCWSVKEKSPAAHHSPIEEVTGDEYFYGQTQQKRSLCCCYFKDFEYEDDYMMHEKPHERTFTESQC
ncbi:myelin protein zero-like protein 3 [Sinocyclocheilus rhinocerous]|uniref:Myelin protein zero-like protein 3 n=1 Tax=Sinocyclocheilus rhinocerous TaxID=307959 RepID=A0A673LDJ5_9TELE|nr:PREDICTED: myelin protein zero-like protein 3 [Sinocyclocheilus rhinocerous]XP_016370800.1 PREDICTED: myelin protein zero-like protein 3 [Sinocyclocheilus rhinocerous]XP_016370801.1 PREDICTED: myelin protein zero-like protein 3 [Sinocyclocheilus rhinocerous]